MWMARYNPKSFFSRNVSATKLGGLQSGSERCQNGTISFSHLEWNPRFLGPQARNFVSVMNKLFRMYCSRRRKCRIFTAVETPDLVATGINRMGKCLRRKWWWPVLKRQTVTFYTVCPTRYRTRHFFNNFTNNKDIATKFEAGYRHIPLDFSHNERTPVQISFQYLQWC